MKKETLETEVRMDTPGRKATEDFKETPECQAKTESLDYLDNQALKETPVSPETPVIWAHRDRRAALARWGYQVRLDQRALKETAVRQDIPESEEPTDKKETLEYLESQVSGSQDLQEKRVCWVSPDSQAHLEKKARRVIQACPDSPDSKDLRETKGASGIQVRRVGPVRRGPLDSQVLLVNQVKRDVLVKEACRDLWDHEETRESLEWMVSLAPQAREETQVYLVLVHLGFLDRLATKVTKVAPDTPAALVSRVYPVSKETRDFQAYRDPWVSLERRVLRVVLWKAPKEIGDHLDNSEKQASQEYRDSLAFQAATDPVERKEIRVCLVSRARRDTRAIPAFLDSRGLLDYRALTERREREDYRVSLASRVQRVAVETLDSKESWETEDFLEKKVMKALQVRRAPRSLLKETSVSRGIQAYQDLKDQLGFLDIKDSKV